MLFGKHNWMDRLTFWFVFVTMFTSVVPTLDLVIENAKIVDGTGSPWFYGNVGILGDRIVEVWNLTAGKVEATEVVDAKGGFLSPGFIDSHTHDDIAVLEYPQNPAKILQGVTTIVTGNCGFSNFPDGNKEAVQSHLSSLLGEIKAQNFFQTFSDYSRRMKENGIGPNVASLVGHGPIRLSVVGSENRKATPMEILQMKQLLEKQLEAGAIGLSLGLVYAPSSYAGYDELVGLAASVAKYDRILSAHIRSYEGNLLESIDEFLKILRESGAKGLLSHLQVAGVPYWGSISKALEKISEAIAEGVDVRIDMYPYLGGSSTIIQLLPPSAMSGGFEEFEDRLQNDPDYFDILKHLTENGTEPGWESKIALIGWENVVINSVVNPELRDIEGMSIPDGTRKLGYATEFEFLIFVILLDSGRSNVIMFQQSNEDNQKVLQSKFQMVGSDSIPRSGGKPHPRGYGTFPRVVGRLTSGYEGVLQLEEAVRKCTSLPAERFNIKNRGMIKSGMMADFVLFTQDFNDTATYEDPMAIPTGIEGVWVQGVRVVKNGNIIPELPGTVIHL